MCFAAHPFGAVLLVVGVVAAVDKTVLADHLKCASVVGEVPRCLVGGVAVGTWARYLEGVVAVDKQAECEESGIEVGGRLALFQPAAVPVVCGWWTGHPPHHSHPHSHHMVGSLSTAEHIRSGCTVHMKIHTIPCLHVR